MENELMNIPEIIDVKSRLCAVVESLNFWNQDAKSRSAKVGLPSINSGQALAFRYNSSAALCTIE